jgi:hypothetical protein
MKGIIFSCLLILICLGGCQKENDNQKSSLDKLIGLYCGKFKVQYGEGTQQTSISQTDIDSLKFIYNNFASIGSPVIVRINKNLTFFIDKQTFKPDYYYATVTGFGFYDTARGLMHISYHMAYKNVNMDDQDGIIEQYNVSSFSYGGTYSGDSTTMVISSGNDTVDISLRFPENWVPCGWDHIRAINSRCYIDFIPETLKDACSGELRYVEGYAKKHGNKLEMRVTTVTPLTLSFREYEFTVTKVSD